MDRNGFLGIFQFLRPSSRLETDQEADFFTQEALQGIFAQKYLLKFPNDGGKKSGKRENPLPLFIG
jgi:hypothetical protein